MTARAVDREQLACAAGFFDGEGFIGAYLIGKISPKITPRMSQVDRAPLDRFAGLAGTR